MNNYLWSSFLGIVHLRIVEGIKTFVYENVQTPFSIGEKLTMKFHLRFLATVAMALLFVFSGCVTHSKKVSQGGYQEFEWGMSRTAVDSILRRNNVSISSISDNEIKVKSRLEFTPPRYSVDIDKSFEFLNDSLGKVVLSYHSNPYLKIPLDSIYARFQTQINDKYGKTYYDTLTSDKRMRMRLTIWNLQEGSIQLRSIELPKSSASGGEAQLKLLLDGITLIYGRTGFEGEMERDKKEKTAKEF